MKIYLAIAIIAVSMWAFPSHAVEISRNMTAEDIEALLLESGLGAQITKDKTTGAPVAYGKSGQIDFIVRALDCAGRPAKCRRLLFFANFDLGRDLTQADYRIVNQFNESEVDGRAYVIERTNQIGVDYYIDLTGGVTAEHIKTRAGRWQRVLSKFIERLTSSSAGA